LPSAGATLVNTGHICMVLLPVYVIRPKRTSFCSECTTPVSGAITLS
jgi:hypothetical protein